MGVLLHFHDTPPLCWLAHCRQEGKQTLFFEAEINHDVDTPPDWRIQTRTAASIQEDQDAVAFQSVDGVEYVFAIEILGIHES